MKITIEEMLVERDIISRQQLERVKEIQKSHEDKSLTDMLLLLGYTTEDVIMNCFSAVSYTHLTLPTILRV